MDANNLPGYMDTPEMRQAFDVLDHFVRDEHEYSLYMNRLIAISDMASWESEMNELKDSLEQKTLQLEHERREKERERREKERECREKERECREKERERLENERLRALLKKAGLSEEEI